MSALGREGARLLGLEDEVGGLEAGKVADVVAVDGAVATGHLEPAPA